MEKIRNAYPDAQKRLFKREKEDMMVMLQIMELLDETGYMLEAITEDGEAYIVLTKVDYQ